MRWCYYVPNLLPAVMTAVKLLLVMDSRSFKAKIHHRINKRKCNFYIQLQIKVHSNKWQTKEKHTLGITCEIHWSELLGFQSHLLCQDNQACVFDINIPLRIIWGNMDFVNFTHLHRRCPVNFFRLSGKIKYRGNEGVVISVGLFRQQSRGMPFFLSR